MNVFKAISDAVQDSHRFHAERKFAEKQGVLDSLGSALQDWLPYNDGYFYHTYLLPDESVPGRLVFDTHTMTSKSPMTAALARRYRTVVKEGLSAITLQMQGPPTLPGERAQVLEAIENRFIERMSRELPEDEK